MVSKSRLDRIERGIDEAQEGQRRKIWAPTNATPDELREFRAENPDAMIYEILLTFWEVNPEERAKYDALQQEGVLDEVTWVVFSDPENPNNPRRLKGLH